MGRERESGWAGGGADSYRHALEQGEQGLSAEPRERGLSRPRAATEISFTHKTDFSLSHARG